MNAHRVDEGPWRALANRLLLDVSQQTYKCNSTFTALAKLYRMSDGRLGLGRFSLVDVHLSSVLLNANSRLFLLIVSRLIRSSEALPATRTPRPRRMHRRNALGGMLWHLLLCSAQPPRVHSLPRVLRGTPARPSIPGRTLRNWRPVAVKRRAHAIVPPKIIFAAFCQRIPHPDGSTHGHPQGGVALVELAPVGVGPVRKVHLAPTDGGDGRTPGGALGAVAEEAEGPGYLAGDAAIARFVGGRLCGRCFSTHILCT